VDLFERQIQGHVAVKCNILFISSTFTLFELPPSFEKYSIMGSSLLMKVIDISGYRFNN
jgi:hypothetical protein